MEREQFDETFYSFPKISTGPKGKHWPAKNAFENPVADLAGVVLGSWTIRLQSEPFTVLGASAGVVGGHGVGSRRHPNQPGHSWKRRRLQRPIPGLLRVAIYVSYSRSTPAPFTSEVRLVAVEFQSSNAQP